MDQAGNLALRLLVENGRDLAGAVAVELFEQAADYGGTEDRFRRRITRALDKAGLREALKL